MSKIETAAKAAVVPLLRGEPDLLDTINQRLLASFLCLVSMRLELSSHEVRSIPEVDRIHLMNTFEPSDYWTIWIGRFVPQEANDHFFMHCGMQIASPHATEIGPEHCNTQVTTLVAGQFCAHLLSAWSWPSHLIYEPPLVRIWPPYPFTIDTWSLPALDEPGVIALHETIPRTGRGSPKGMKRSAGPSRAVLFSVQSSRQF